MLAFDHAELLHKALNRLRKKGFVAHCPSVAGSGGVSVHGLTRPSIRSWTVTAQYSPWQFRLLQSARKEPINIKHLYSTKQEVGNGNQTTKVCSIT